MLFNRLVKTGKGNLERYIFYRSLGYSVEASELLACLTYGSEALAYRMESFPGGDALIRLHTWLEEQDEAEPAAWPEGGRTPYEAAQMLLRRVRVQEWTPPRQVMEADQPGQAPLTGWEPEGVGFSGEPEPAAGPDALERTQIQVQGGTGNMDPEEMSQAFRRDARRYDE